MNADGTVSYDVSLQGVFTGCWHNDAHDCWPSRFGRRHGAERLRLLPGRRGARSDQAVLGLSPAGSAQCLHYGRGSEQVYNECRWHGQLRCEPGRGVHRRRHNDDHDSWPSRFGRRHRTQRCHFNLDDECTIRPSLFRSTSCRVSTVYSRSVWTPNHFTVNADGSVAYDARLEGAFTDDGTSSLTIVWRHLSHST